MAPRAAIRERLREWYRGWYGCSGSVSDREWLLSLRSGKQPVNSGRSSSSNGDKRVLTAVASRSCNGEAEYRPTPPPFSLRREAIREDTCVDRPH